MRRFPEYRLSYTVAAMSTVWEDMSGLKLSPAAIDSSSQLIALTYALDDIYDYPEFDRENYQGMDRTESLGKAFNAVNLSGYSGHDMMDHLVSTVALDFPPEQSRQNEIVDDTVAYLSDFHAVHVEPKRDTWDFQSALAMRKRVSGDLGKLVGKMFAYSAGDRNPNAGIAAMQIMGIAGQFHDDLWDLCEENTQNTHNMFLLLAREHYPVEHEAITRTIQRLASQGHDMISYDELQDKAPLTIQTYVEEMKLALFECLPRGEPVNERLGLMVESMGNEFEPFLRSIKRSPVRATKNKIDPRLTKRH